MSTSTTFAGQWSSLPTPLSPWILQTVQSMGHTQMTPVQAATIPLFMRHKDVVVEAVTGSGKTLAFVIPVLERLARRETRFKKDEIGALVISPTRCTLPDILTCEADFSGYSHIRELARQIHSVFSLFLNAESPSQSTLLSDKNQHENTGHSTTKLPSPLLLISSEGSSPLQDIQRFLSTGADIVIGTPGRVEEFLLGKGRGAANVKEFEVLVLDEADRLLDLGFHKVLTRIIAYLPKQRRTGLFSATMTDALSELVRVGLRNPARIVVKVQSKKRAVDVRASDGNLTNESAKIEERRIPANLEIYYLTCKASEKLVQLVRIIDREVSECHSAQFIVYFATCACVDYFYRVLQLFLPTSATLYSLHGHLPPAARTRTLNSFATSPATSFSSAILLTTDVAARGLDLPHVDVIIQFDPPADPKTFSHRCGRTARAGRSGRAWVLLVGREEEYVDFLAVRKIPLKYRPYLSAVPSTESESESEDRPEDTDVAPYLTRIRELLLSDRALHDKSMKAFVSHVRAYSMHEASYIFRIKDLDLIGVARCFGLLRLPNMPEFKDRDKDGWEDAKVEWHEYAYKNEAQELKRREMEASHNHATKTRNEKYAEKRKRNSAWSQQHEQKTEKQKRKEKKVRKAQWLRAQQKNGAEPVNPTRSKRERAEFDQGGDPNSEDDWAELVREEKMAKKLRRGDIDQATFDREFGEL